MAATRQPDTVRVEVIANGDVAGGQLDAFTSLVIVNDITMPSEASFEIGDNGTWAQLGDIFMPGVQFQVVVNDRPRLRGRVEMNDVPFDTQAGAVVRFTVRTKLSDAMYASANQGIRVRNTSIKDFILALYEPMGYTESDFDFAPYVTRDLLTGRRSGITKPIPDIERIKVSEARVNPPETVYAAADRHLRRHGLMHWDSPDGRIVVAEPDDEQAPTWRFNMYRGGPSGAGDPSTNNVMGATRTRDWSGLPAAIGVFGRRGKRDFTKARIAGVAVDQDVVDAGFYRPVVIVSEGIRTKELAERSAARELSARSKRKDGFSVAVDGWTSWNGSEQFIYSPDTVANVNTDVAGGDAGPYYVHAVTLTRNAYDGDTTELSMVKRGIWRI